MKLGEIPMSEITPYRTMPKSDVNDFSISELEEILINKKGINSLKEKIINNGYCVFIKEFTIKKFLRKEYKVYKIYIPECKIISSQIEIDIEPPPHIFGNSPDCGPGSRPREIQIHAEKKKTIKHTYTFNQFTLFDVTEQYGKFVIQTQVLFENNIGNCIKTEKENLRYNIINSYNCGENILVFELP